MWADRAGSAVGLSRSGSLAHLRGTAVRNYTTGAGLADAWAQAGDEVKYFGRGRDARRRMRSQLSPRPKVYLDLNIYDSAVKRGWVKQLEQALRSERAVVHGSVELLIEAMRIDNDRLRRQIVATIVATVDRRLPPAGHRYAQEVLGEIRRCHPDWLEATPNRLSESAALVRATQLWQRLRQDPGYLPWGMKANAALLHGALGSGRAGQRARRALMSKRKEPDVLHMLGDTRRHLEAVVLSMSSAERHWRVVGGALWWDALRGDPQLADMRTWLGGYLHPPDQLSRTEWMTSWCTQVSAAAIAVHIALLMAEYHQIEPGVKLQTSNALDVLHVPYLLGLDLVLTADTSFAKVLSSVRVDVGESMAEVGTFDWGTNWPGFELRRVLAATPSVVE